PYPDPVDGLELINTFENIINKYIFIAPEYCIASTLWAFLTYVYDAFSICPMLLITSPTRRCGKTTFLEVLEGLTYKGFIVTNQSASASFRVIDENKPTILADEAENKLINDEEIRGIFNAGHTRRTAYVLRCEKVNREKIKVKRFDVWCPKAIALIGKAPPTWEDRSIIIHMQRKPTEEKKEKMPKEFYELHRPYREKALKWAQENFDALKKANPQIPSIPNDRAMDNWFPLIVIADLIGGVWPKKVRRAMIKINEIEEKDDLKIELLKDIKEVFESLNKDKISSSELVEALVNMDDRPWAEWNKGKPLTPNKLARLLRSFGIRPKTQRYNKDIFKGYSKESFKEVFNRYIPPFQTVTQLQSNEINNLEQNQKVTQKNNVTFKNEPKYLKSKGCYSVTVSKGGSKEKNFIYEID
ncbi:MAG: hypothetical protein DRP55_03205, partial [Spirochaetes bacterium]